MTTLRLLICCLVAALGFAGELQAKNKKHEHNDLDQAGGGKSQTILIVRHAEKPLAGPGLSSEGEKRAKTDVQYFQNYALDGKPLQLDHLYAAGDSKHSHRSRLTLEPLATALGKTLDLQFKDQDTTLLAADIHNHHQGQGLLIAWHHGEIPNLLRALGVDPSSLFAGGKWPEEQLGWVIELRYDAEGKLASSRCVEQKFP